MVWWCKVNSRTIELFNFCAWGNEHYKSTVLKQDEVEKHGKEAVNPEAVMRETYKCFISKFIVPNPVAVRL